MGKKISVLTVTRCRHSLPFLILTCTHALSAMPRLRLSPSLSPTMSLTSLARLPSALYNAAITKGHLLPDASQRAALPILDKLVSKLPAYEQAMSSHAKTLSGREKARAKAVAKERRRRQHAGVAGRLWLHAMDMAAGRPPDVHAEALPDSYYGLRDKVQAPVPPRGVYLYGDVGCGKSLLMDMVFTCAEGRGCAAQRVHYHSFMMSVYEYMHWYDRMSEEERVERGLYHPLDAVVGMKLQRMNSSETGGGLLCFDEFQVADVGDARLMHGVFSRLLDSGTIVCFTANRAPAELNRSQLMDTDFRLFLDLLHDRCKLMELGSGVDYREVLAETDAGGMYYLSKNAGMEEMYRTWERITGVQWDDVVSRVLPVAYGREFVLRRAVKDAVQLTTKELIEAAVGASDFRALAENVKTIFITDVVPVFTSETRNLARRFITLIDVCYEEKVRLVMRTEAERLDDMFNRVEVGGAVFEIAEGMQFETELAREGIGAANRGLGMGTLYTGEDEAFAFDRAVSRLKEMQTEGFDKRTPMFW